MRRGNCYYASEALYHILGGKAKGWTPTLAAQGDTIKVLHTLTPIGVAMAGAGETDPYKD